MTRPIVIDVIGRDRTGAAMKSAAESQKNLARQIDATNKGSDNLRKSQLGLIAAQERYNKVAQNTGSSVGQLASAQKGLITAQQRVATETRKATVETEKFAKTADRAGTKFKPLLDSALLLGPALVPVGAAAVAAGAGLVGLGAAGVLAFKGIQREMKQGTDLGKQYQATFKPVIDEFHQLEHIAAANVFGGINKGIQESRTLFPQINQDVGTLSSRLGNIAGSVGAGLVALFHDLNPLFLGMATYVDQGAGAFQRWAQTSDGPKQFVAYAQAQLPKVEALFLNVSKAVEHIAVAAAPLGGAVLQALGGIANAISRIPVPILTAMIAALQVGRLVAIGKALTGVASGFMAIAATSLGPLALIAAGTFGLSKALQSVTDKLPAYLQGFSLLSHSGDDYNKQVSNTVDLLQSQYVQALKQGTAGQKDLIDSTIAAGKSLTDIQIVVMDAGGDWGKYAQAVTGTDQQYQTYLATVKAGAVAHGATNDTIKQITDTLGKLRQAYLDGKLSAADYATAEANVTAQLDISNLSLGDAMKKYNDAFDAAHTLTAELGYLSTALATQSGNAVNAKLGALQYTDSLTALGDQVAANTKEFNDNGTSLNTNTVEGRKNYEWALQQIQAINNLAVTQATATGSIKTGTDSLKTNEAALRTSMYQAGFTKKQVDDLITTYGATPDKISTSIEEQGSAAVLQALGDILNQLHAIADPVWGAKFDFAMNNPSLKRGFARGGQITGPGGPTSDVIPILASSGEYVVNAAATQKHLGLLENINRNKYAFGGQVGRIPQVAGVMQAAGLPGDLNINTNGLASEWSQYGQVLSGALADATTRAAAEIAKQAAAAAGTPGHWTGTQLDWVIAAEKVTGTPASWTAAILRRIMFESGGNPNAINNWDSNAMAGDPSRGLMQTIGATFNAYHQAGTSSNIYDPVANIAAALNYIKSRYGSIFAIDPPVQGYRNGGMVDRTGLAFLHRGEEVLTSQAAGHRGSGVVVAPGAITVYAARGQDERQIAAQAFTMLKAWVAEEGRRAAKGGRA